MDRAQHVMITPAAADDLASAVLGDLRTRLGGLHLEHARRVAAAVAGHGDRAVVAALLHDTVEHGRIAWSDLAAAVDNEGVVRTIDALTQREGESDADYLRRCAADRLATLVKRADLLDKLGPQDVDPDVADHARVRHEASERLALFEQIVAEHPS